MFVELIELLRCPNAHEESPLIAAARRTDARHIMDGVLGCPLCRSEFPIENGVARFVSADHPRASPVPLGERSSAEQAMRLAAFLELTDARGFALLAGRWAVHADQVGRIADTPLVLVNPDVLPGAAAVAGTIVVGDVLPFAPKSARAAALDGEESDALTSSVVGALRDRGRLLGPVTRSPPPGVTELARDDRAWVAEKNAAPDVAPRLTSLERPRRG